MTLGQLTVVHTVEDSVHCILTPLDIVERFQRGRGRTKHTDRLIQQRPVDGHIATMIAGRILLLVRGLVLLIHNHELEILHGREDR